MDTLIIRPNESIEAAAETILRGGLVAFPPTETVYGLGADAFNPAAVRRIYQVKGRPADNPSIVHIASLDQLVDVAVDVPDELFKALRRVWPGPFTVVLRKSSKVPPETTGGDGIRLP